MAREWVTRLRASVLLALTVAACSSGPASAPPASGSQAAGSAPSGPSTFSSTAGSFTPGTSITPGASAAELALQLKFGIGLGYKGLDLRNYVAFVPAIGQVTGSAVAGELCENYYGDFKIAYNAEAHLFGLSYATPAAILYEKKATYEQPGCT